MKTLSAIFVLSKVWVMLHALRLNVDIFFIMTVFWKDLKQDGLAQEYCLIFVTVLYVNNGFKFLQNHK